MNLSAELKGKMSVKADIFFMQGHVLVMDVDIEAFREFMRVVHGVVGFDETKNEYGIVHVQRWQ